MCCVMGLGAANAQTWNDVKNGVTDASKWAAGLRIGSGVQIQAEYRYSGENYFEARFGTYWANSGGTVMADFTLLHQWNVANMDWTPSAGQWFFDAGCGVNVGGREHYAYVGAAGSVKLGIKFNNAPIRLALDWTPSFGPHIAYWKGYSHAEFNEWALCNIGLSAVYCF